MCGGANGCCSRILEIDPLSKKSNRKRELLVECSASTNVEVRKDGEENERERYVDEMEQSGSCGQIDRPPVSLSRAGDDLGVCIYTE